PDQAFADVIALADEKLPEKLLAINADPLATDDEIELTDFVAKPLQLEVVGANASSIETDVMKLQTSMKHQLAQLPK
ncbi:nicotinate phosphoribosyltransferase, partial [Roseburia faecis]|nr:nicotinate phosphoribosyltransferase [Roseburia faecis]